MADKFNRGSSFSGQHPQASSGQGITSTVPQGQSAAGGLMENVKDKAQELASQVADRAEEAWDSTRQHAQQWAGAAAHGAEEAWMSASDFFRRYPVPMFFAGMALGFLVARCLDNMSADMTARMSGSSNRVMGM
jgi:hypothetical protein